jgi:adenylate cyclase class IV
MQSYEVEVKALLGGPGRAEELRRAMKKLDPSCELLAVSRQLNHYFEPAAPHGAKKTPIEQLREEILPLIGKSASARLAELASKATDYSVRTRLSEKNDAKSVFLIVKASVGDDTSSNGVARMEFDENVVLPLQELDELVMSCGFSYQAKWSRQREEYVCKGVNVTLDKNAGYGWLAEFERIVNDGEKVDEAESQVRALMNKLKVQELPQDRLERMFAHYNEHWQEYYGTDNIFVIE